MNKPYSQLWVIGETPSGFVATYSSMQDEDSQAVVGLTMAAPRLQQLRDMILARNPDMTCAEPLQDEIWGECITDPKPHA